MLVPTRARPRLQRPSVSWWHVIVMLERHGYTHGAIAAAIGSARANVENWKNRAEPKHTDGELLIELWCNVTQQDRSELPTRTDRVLSAASFR